MDLIIARQSEQMYREKVSFLEGAVREQQNKSRESLLEETPNFNQQ